MYSTISKVFAVLAVAAFASANDLHEGLNHTEGLQPVFQGHYVAEWTLAGPTKEVFANVSGLITGINVTDLRPGKNGVAKIVSGGIGHDNVTISLQSPAAFRGYDFTVEVFADEKVIERGSRDVEDENTTASVSTSTTGKPTASPITAADKSSEPTSQPRLTLPTEKPQVSSTGPTDQTEITGYPTDKPKLDMQIPEEVKVPMKIKVGFNPPHSEKHI